MGEAIVNAVTPFGRFEWERQIRRSTIPGPAKLVALMAATYANSDGSSIHPGVQNLMRDCDMSRATVMRHLKTLRETGLMTVVTKANHRAGRANDMRLTVPVDARAREAIGLCDPQEHVSPVRHDSEDKWAVPVDDRNGPQPMSHQRDMPCPISETWHVSPVTPHHTSDHTSNQTREREEHVASATRERSSTPQAA